MRAVCVLAGDAAGHITFDQPSPAHPTVIAGYILNLPKGLHGFHVHEFGDTSNGCTSAGEHFNPFRQDHGAPDALVHHVGDLGNVESAGFNSLTPVDMVSTSITLHGPHTVLGRSLVVHTDRDDLGLTDHPLSKTTGNSGGRLACGIIGVADDVAPHDQF